jgi:hypothetical protein
MWHVNQRHNTGWFVHRPRVERRVGRRCRMRELCALEITAVMLFLYHTSDPPQLRMGVMFTIKCFSTILYIHTYILLTLILHTHTHFLSNSRGMSDIPPRRPLLEPTFYQNGGKPIAVWSQCISTFLLNHSISILSCCKDLSSHRVRQREATLF